MYTHAIVRPPGPNFADGITTAKLGRPDLAKALAQHEAYCQALEACGLTLVRLPPDPRFPDSTFVEDAAVLTPDRAILTHPGAESRRGEIDEIHEPISRFFRSVERIEPPGTLDGGDVCESGDRMLIGISARTNEEGAHQLSNHVMRDGYQPALIDIRSIPGILHLKSGVSCLGEGRFAVIDALRDHEVFRGQSIVRVPQREEYAANCVRVHDTVLLASGYPHMESLLGDLGLRVLTLEMSEFRTMDGGLSCLSLRF